MFLNKVPLAITINNLNFLVKTYQILAKYNRVKPFLYFSIFSHVITNKKIL